MQSLSPATSLAFTTHPANLAAGGFLPPITVRVLDQSGHPVSASGTVTLSLSEVPSIPKETEPPESGSGSGAHSSSDSGSGSGSDSHGSSDSGSGSSSNSNGYSDGGGNGSTVPKGSNNSSSSPASSSASSSSGVPSSGSSALKSMLPQAVTQKFIPDLDGNLTLTLVNGSANFSSIRVNATGNFVLRVDASGLKSGMSRPFVVSP